MVSVSQDHSRISTENFATAVANPDHELADSIERWADGFMRDVALDVLKLRNGIILLDDLKRMYVRITSSAEGVSTEDHLPYSALSHGSVLKRDVIFTLTSFIKLLVDEGEQSINCICDLAYKVQQTKVYIWLSISWDDEEAADKLEGAAFLAQARASRGRLSAISLMVVDAEKRYPVPNGYTAVLVNGDIYGKPAAASRESTI